MSEFPARSCNRCGAREGMMAQISDPFMDACYGLCRSCLYMPLREHEVVEQPHDERTGRSEMAAVKVTFTYEPDEPDPDHSMGVTEREYDRVCNRLAMALGAEDVEFERVPEDDA